MRRSGIDGYQFAVARDTLIKGACERADGAIEPSDRLARVPGRCGAKYDAAAARCGRRGGAGHVMFPVANGVPLRYLPIATWALIATNAVVFLFEVSLSPVDLVAVRESGRGPTRLGTLSRVLFRLRDIGVGNLRGTEPELHCSGAGRLG